MSTQAGFFDNLIEAARDNPIAAALIGGGALWLFVGEEKLMNAARSATAAASPIVEIGARKMHPKHQEFDGIAAPPTAPEMDHDRSLGVGELLRDAGSTASDTMTGAGGKIRDRFDEGVAYARENLNRVGNSFSGNEALAKTQSALGDVFERQPLVLGAIGLAIGAAVARAFPTSNFEREWMGEASGDVKADLSRRAEAVSESLGEASDTLKAELRDTGAEARDRIKQTGIDAANAAKEKIKSP